MSDAAVPAEPTKRSLLMTALIVIVGVIAIISGVAKMRHGFQEMTGSSVDPKVTALLTESDEAVAVANTHIEAARPDYEALLNGVDNLGLDAVRRDQSASAREVSDHFVEAAKLLRVAKQKLDDAKAMGLDDKIKEFVVAKGESYELMAQVSDKNREIVGLVLDESIANSDALTPKVLEVAAARDELQKQAEAAVAKADALVKKS